MIRLGVHEDIPAIIKIGQEIIDKSETYDGEIDVQKGSYMLRRAINDRKMDLFIATKADQVVGLFIAMEDEEWFSKSKYGTDLAFCVLPEHANHGVWLLRRFLRWCKQRNLKRITLGLSTGMDPEGRTGKMFEAHGLVSVGGIYSTLKGGA